MGFTFQKDYWFVFNKDRKQVDVETLDSNWLILDRRNKINNIKLRLRNG